MVIFSIFSVENRTVTEFSQEKVIKEYKAPKKDRRKVIEVDWAVNEFKMLFFYIL